MKILAFDPGGRTGWCLLADGDITCGSFQLWSEVDVLIKRYQPNIVVAETFLLFPNKANSLWWSDFPASKVMGVIEFVCARTNTSLTTQSPSSRMHIRLKRIEGADKHAFDAARHALQYCSKIRLCGYDHLLTITRPTNSYPQSNGLEKPKNAPKLRFSTRRGPKVR